MEAGFRYGIFLEDAYGEVFSNSYPLFKTKEEALEFIREMKKTDELQWACQGLTYNKVYLHEDGEIELPY